MKGAHTAGPWEVGYGDGKTGATCPNNIPFVGGRNWPYEMVGYGGEVVALVPKQDARKLPKWVAADAAPELRGGDFEANARLIAAAPEGYELIEQLEESFTADGLYQQFLPAMRAYLAKARGQ